MLLGAHSLYGYSMDAWRRVCGAVMQDGFIFSDTIANNIAPGVEVIDKQQLAKAVDTADIREYIDSLTLGFNTKIGQEGTGRPMPWMPIMRR